MSYCLSNDLIVIADDVPLMAELVQYNIDLAGFKNTLVFNDPQVCLDQIQKGIRPSVLISDYQMPHMKGTELLGNVIHLLPDCTGIIMTSNPRSIRSKKLPYPVLKKGGDDFFSELVGILCEVFGVQSRYCDWRAVSI
ncbi:MAG: response regulator [Fibrobacterota bacterium]